MKIAIIGTGISGLAAAYGLYKNHDIVIFEKNSYIGGHARTIDIAKLGVVVDSGFIVFNNRNYPNLLNLFNELGVEYEKTNMSFSASIKGEKLEYSSGNLLNGGKNLRPKFLKMLYDIIRFNRYSLKYKNSNISLQTCVDELKMGEWFCDYYLLAMAAAIWSCSPDKIMNYPSSTFINFFKNHGLLGLTNRPQWYFVKGGSRQYIEKLTKPFVNKIKVKCKVEKIINKGGQFKLVAGGEECVFDKIIFACHADEALQLIESPTRLESDILSAFQYQQNKIIVHGCETFMPTSRKCWSSWNYILPEQSGKNTNGDICVSYYMNKLQNLKIKKPIFVTLNPAIRPSENLIYDEHIFSHPIFDEGSILAQKKIKQIQGNRGLYFCGAYQGYGFHEDGIKSAIEIVENMGEDNE